MNNNKTGFRLYSEITLIIIGYIIILIICNVYSL